ncbi:MAG: hypothetical protein WA210_06205 [Burkholderiaceae bacterium]
MPPQAFESTLPYAEAAGSRAVLGGFAASTVPTDFHDTEADPSTLSPSLRADLSRFEDSEKGTDLLGVLAACLRHSKRVTIHLQCGRHALPLTLFPQEKLLHCSMNMVELMAQHLSELHVLHVEAAWITPPGPTESLLVGKSPLLHPLAPFSWELAMRGARRELLPEIGGAAAYRVSPGMDFARLPVRGPLLASLTRLRNQSANLRELSDWPGLDSGRAKRVLNALYLQAGLIVSRARPEANTDSWFGALGR